MSWDWDSFWLGFLIAAVIEGVVCLPFVWKRKRPEEDWSEWAGWRAE